MLENFAKIFSVSEDKIDLTDLNNANILLRYEITRNGILLFGKYKTTVETEPYTLFVATPGKNRNKNIEIIFKKETIHSKGYLFKKQGKCLVSSMNMTFDSWSTLLESAYLTDKKDHLKKILNYLEDLKNEKIKGAILISGFSYNLEYQGYNNELLNFFQKAVNFKKVKKHCKKFIILHSTHDPYVPIKHAYLLKEKLNAVVIIKKGTSHFSGDEGLTKLPTLLKLIEKI